MLAVPQAGSVLGCLPGDQVHHLALLLADQCPGPVGQAAACLHAGRWQGKTEAGTLASRRACIGARRIPGPRIDNPERVALSFSRKLFCFTESLAGRRNEPGAVCQTLNLPIGSTDPPGSTSRTNKAYVAGALPDQLSAHRCPAAGGNKIIYALPPRKWEHPARAVPCARPETGDTSGAGSP